MSSFWENIRGIFDPKASAAQIIEAVENTYRLAKQDYPDREPHHILSMVYFSRMKLQSKAPVNSQVLRAESLARTFEYACLTFPDNLRALGIAMIHHERPDVTKKCPDLERDYNLLMAPVREARKRGGMDELYRKFNPRMAYELE